MWSVWQEYCETKSHSVTSKGLFQGDNPLNHTLSAILIQLCSAIVITTCLRRILNQPRFVAERNLNEINRHSVGVSMHDDICTLALDKGVSILITPFQKSETIPRRGVKRNVLDKAPCSVGILVNKRIILSRNVHTLGYNLCLVFLGGPDSREALAFATRMMDNPATRVTVIRLIAEDEFISDLLETKLDIRAITELTSLFGDEGRRVEYKEVIVKDGAQTIEVLRSINDEYDLMLVGRRVDADSPLVSGLADWTYEPELGIVGDILASTDMTSTAPVLVIQQQSTVEDLLQISMSPAVGTIET